MLLTPASEAALLELADNSDWTEEGPIVVLACSDLALDDGSADVTEERAEELLLGLMRLAVRKTFTDMQVPAGILEDHVDVAEHNTGCLLQLCLTHAEDRVNMLAEESVLPDSLVIPAALLLFMLASIRKLGGLTHEAPTWINIASQLLLCWVAADVVDHGEDVSLALLPVRSS